MGNTRRVPLNELEAIVGERLGPSSWLVIDQQRINGFADATGDYQWIHVDVERARLSTFGGTIAHGYLTLSLVPVLANEVLALDGVGTSVNYGLDRVRFASPVPVDSRVRATVTVLDVQAKGTGLLVKRSVEVEVDGKDRPACLAESLVLYYPADQG